MTTYYVQLEDDWCSFRVEADSPQTAAVERVADCGGGWEDGEEHKVLVQGPDSLAWYRVTVTVETRFDVDRVEEGPGAAGRGPTTDIA